LGRGQQPASVAQQVERQEDDTARELGELARIFDPSEVHASKLEETQRLCQSQAEARAALECMRDHAAEIYRIHTGSPWSSASGSRASAAPYASQIEARDFMAARRRQARSGQPARAYRRGDRRGAMVAP
jgi:hypothetical protein